MKKIREMTIGTRLTLLVFAVNPVIAALMAWAFLIGFVVVFRLMDGPAHLRDYAASNDTVVDGHPELGGIDQRVGIFNPPYELLPEVCDQQSAAFLRVAAMMPRIRFGDVSIENLTDGLRRVDITVENRGYLPSYGLGSAKKLSWNENPELVKELIKLHKEWLERCKG